jgi:hypothetical protein
LVALRPTQPQMLKNNAMFQAPPATAPNRTTVTAR